jgi:general secretion pathway protein J
VYRYRSQQAFTLIEVLVALGIFAILTTLIYGTFTQSHNISTRLEATSERYQAVRQLFQIMLDDLTAAYYLDPTGTNPTPLTVFIGTSPGTTDSFSTTQPLLRFTTLGHRRWQPNSPETDLSLVEYKIEKSENSDLLTLLHREETNLLSTSEASMEEYELAEGLKELSVRFFDGTDWSDSWDAAAKQGLPQAVEVKFAIPIENEDREFSFRAPIPSAKPFVTGVIKPSGGAKP